MKFRKIVVGFLAKTRSFVSSQIHLDCLWCPLSLLLKGYRALFHFGFGGGGVKLTTYPYRAELKNGGSYTPLSHTLSWHVHGQRNTYLIMDKKIFHTTHSNHYDLCSRLHTCSILIIMKLKLHNICKKIQDGKNKKINI